MKQIVNETQDKTQDKSFWMTKKRQAILSNSLHFLGLDHSSLRFERKRKSENKKRYSLVVYFLVRCDVQCPPPPLLFPALLLSLLHWLSSQCHWASHSMSSWLQWLTEKGKWTKERMHFRLHRQDFCSGNFTSFCCFPDSFSLFPSSRTDMMLTERNSGRREKKESQEKTLWKQSRGVRQSYYSRLIYQITCSHLFVSPLTLLRFSCRKRNYGFLPPTLSFLLLQAVFFLHVSFV